MRRFVLLAVAVLVVSPFARAADPVPTAAELKDIKQLSEDIFGLATRKQACEKLGDYGPKARSAIPNLTEMLTSGKEPVADVRVVAIAALEKIGGPAVPKALTSVLTDGKEEDAGVLVAAAIALARIGGPNAVKTLKAVAENQKHPEVMIACLAGLIRTGDKSPEAMRAVTAWLADDSANALDAGVNEVRFQAVRGLLGAAGVSDELNVEIEKVLVIKLPAVMRPTIISFGDGFGEGVLMLFLGGVPKGELKRQMVRDAEKARAKERDAQEKEAREFTVQFDRVFDRAGADVKALVVRAFVRVSLANVEKEPSSAEQKWATDFAEWSPYGRAIAAAQLVAKAPDEARRGLPMLKDLLKDPSPLVAAVAADAIAKIEKK